MAGRVGCEREVVGAGDVGGVVGILSEYIAKNSELYIPLFYSQIPSNVSVY